MIILRYNSFQAQDGDPSNLEICQPKTWGVRMLIETVFFILPRISWVKQMSHRAWAYFTAHLNFAVTTFNLLVQWHGLKPDENGFVKLSIAEFCL
ncbi:MAG: hypothetical protein ACKVJG_18255 [Candidatus Latescibacterota bacterium]